MTIVTRFAPSPTGYLHIGGSRTALFNYLFARHNNGKFLLRVEDTDRQRSTDEAIEAIFSGMKWLGLDWDGDVVYQFGNSKRHAQIAKKLLEDGKAYKCYLTVNELEALREESRKTGVPIHSPWRDMQDNCPEGSEYVVRIKTPRNGNTIVADIVQGDVITKNEVLDDLILLRSDGTPTYNLAVVVDDHDMGVTHIIRGDDHLNNAAKQQLIYEALGWKVPVFAHIPLIHGEDGAKLSKRHGALGVDAYKDMGYLPEALNNYLIRLGWSHGNDEIITSQQAIDWFNLEAIGKAPSRMDFKKLANVNAHYIKTTDDAKLLEMMLGISSRNYNKDDQGAILKAMYLIKERAKTLKEIEDISSIFLVGYNSELSEELADKLSQQKELYTNFYEKLITPREWNKDSLMNFAKEYAENNQLKLGQLIMPFRIALTGSEASPSVFDIMEIIGREETVKRLKKHL